MGESFFKIIGIAKCILEQFFELFNLWRFFGE